MERMEKQTAVEWQFEQLFNSFEKFNNGEYTFNDFLKRNLEIRKQAKEMFEKQIKDAWENGFREFYDGSSTPEEYYNKTFKTE
jgi:LAS superfamily LD-carboxypeptidase LdcB